MTDSERRRLGELIREAREYLGLSQEEVAEHLGVSRPAVSQIENGNRRVDTLELEKLSKLFDRPVSYFVHEKTAQDPPQIELLRRAAADLSEQDRDEVVRFAEFLRGRAGSTPKK